MIPNEVQTILSDYSSRTGKEVDSSNIKDFLIQLLREYSSISLEDLKALARYLKLSPVFLYQLYDEVSSELIIERQIILCDNLTCLSKGARELKKYLLASMDDFEERGWAVEFRKCLGSCSAGPCALVCGGLKQGVAIRDLELLLEA